MFKDKNLKLALLNYTKSLQEKYQYGWDAVKKYDYEWDADYDQFCLKNFGKLIRNNRFEVSHEIESFFLNLEISKKDLESITHISLDGGNSVYSYIIDDVECWDEYFDIHSIEGIENCINLKKIDLNVMVNKASLKPLIYLNSLEEICLDCDSATSYTDLLNIPNLKKINVYNPYYFEKSDKEELLKLIPILEKKGISVLDSKNEKFKINLD